MKPDKTYCIRIYTQEEGKTILKVLSNTFKDLTWYQGQQLIPETDTYQEWKAPCYFTMLKKNDCKLTWSESHHVPGITYSNIMTAQEFISKVIFPLLKPHNA